MIELIRKSQYRQMPWKNGLGITSEIAIFPAGSELSRGDFLWRLSSARVGAANSFSHFPGYDRLLTVMVGHGLRMNRTELKRNQVIRFRGDDEIECELIDGPVEDLGIIFRRDSVGADMSVETAGNVDTSQALTDGTCFIIPLSAQGMIVQSIRVEQHDTIKIEGLRSVVVKSSQDESLYLKILIRSV